MCVCECVCVIMMGECVCVCLCACMRTPSCRGAVSTSVSSLQVTFRVGVGFKKRRHSCCLVTGLWLHIIYYTFLLLCQTFTKYDILFFLSLVSLCITQSKNALFSEYVFVVYVFCHISVEGHVIVFVAFHTALVMCIISEANSNGRYHCSDHYIQS